MRIEVEDGVFHVTTRGNARATIFHDDSDYEAFLRRLESTVRDFGWLLHAYCVLPNHYHLLVETPLANLGKGMLVLNGSYARRYNARYDRVGHVFQTPYRSRFVTDDPYFMESLRYIANNPVRAGLCIDPAAWRWSSYRATVALEPCPPFVRLERVYGQFESTAELAAFVAAKGVAHNHVAR